MLTYNRQGVCAGEKPRYDCSAGIPDYPKEWKDIVGAVRFAQASGAKAVAIAGASIGGTGSIYAAQSGLIRPAAVISLAGANYISTYQLEREQLEKIGRSRGSSCASSSATRRPERPRRRGRSRPPPRSHIRWLSPESAGR